MNLETLSAQLMSSKGHWLVTGCAGFIGSHLLEFLLKSNQQVTGVDNFLTGSQFNLDDVKKNVSAEQWQNFNFVKGDICERQVTDKCTKNVDYILHQAALGAVPRSIESPLDSHDNNVTGTVNLLWSAQCNGVKKVVYASSSSVYGDNEKLPKVELETGNCLSPYAATKAICELYADNFHRVYDLKIAGLRYFNVFGPRQSVNGPYAAVIPKWVALLLQGEKATINGDGETSRDFCYVDNAVQANVLCALDDGISSNAKVYNVAVGDRTTLNELHESICKTLMSLEAIEKPVDPVYAEFRAGDIRHSQANISALQNDVGFEPSHKIDDGMAITLTWFMQNKEKLT